VPTLAEALQRLCDQAKRTPPKEWVRVVGGWSELQFAERRMPTLEEINEAVPDNPAFVLQSVPKCHAQSVGSGRRRLQSELLQILRAV